MHKIRWRLRRWACRFGVHSRFMQVDSFGRVLVCRYCPDVKYPTYNPRYARKGRR